MLMISKHILNWRRWCTMLGSKYKSWAHTLLFDAMHCIGAFNMYHWGPINTIEIHHIISYFLFLMFAGLSLSGSVWPLVVEEPSWLWWGRWTPAWRRPASSVWGSASSTGSSGLLANRSSLSQEYMSSSLLAGRSLLSLAGRSSSSLACRLT